MPTQPQPTSGVKLTLRFADPALATRFRNMCLERHIPVMITQDGLWTVCETVHVNKTAKQRLVSTWAKLTCEIQDADRYQRKLKL